VVRKHKDHIFIATVGGLLKVTTVMAENDEYLNDTIRVGTRFFTPRNVLESAMQYRAVQTPHGFK
jgi:hypothetical protein